MCVGPFPVINMKATGSRIQSLRKERGLSVRDIQEFFHFEEPRAIYKWLNGQSIPSVDNLLAKNAENAKFLNLREHSPRLRISA